MLGRELPDAREEAVSTAGHLLQERTRLGHAGQDNRAHLRRVIALGIDADVHEYLELASLVLLLDLPAFILGRPGVHELGAPRAVVGVIEYLGESFGGADRWTRKQDGRPVTYRVQGGASDGPLSPLYRHNRVHLLLVQLASDR